jgi:hypothetical protein
MTVILLVIKSLQPGTWLLRKKIEQFFIAAKRAMWWATAQFKVHIAVSLADILKLSNMIQLD